MSNRDNVLLTYPVEVSVRLKLEQRFVDCGWNLLTLFENDPEAHDT